MESPTPHQHVLYSREKKKVSKSCIGFIYLFASCACIAVVDVTSCAVLVLFSLRYGARYDDSGAHTVANNATEGGDVHPSKKAKFQCQFCSKSYTRKYNCQQHQKTCPKRPPNLLLAIDGECISILVQLQVSYSSASCARLSLLFAFTDTLVHLSWCVPKLATFVDSKIVNRDGMFACPFCFGAATYQRAGRMVNHVNKEHSDELLKGTGTFVIVFCA